MKFGQKSIQRLALVWTLARPDWHLTTDSLGGLRQSTWDSSVWFAVSQSTTWDPTATYEAPDGYRVATTAEAMTIFIPVNVAPPYVYYNQGGWSGYVWGGAARYYFRFADSAITNSYKHVGNFDSYQVQYSAATSNFAGMVLIAVPEPSSAFLLGLGSFGLLARRNRKRC